MKHFTVLLFLSSAACSFAEAKPVDFWDEELRLFSTARSAQPIDANLAAHRLPSFSARGFTLDHANKKVGDLSVRYTPAKAGMPQRFGFMANLWGSHWVLSTEHILKLWIKAENAPTSRAWKVQLVDVNGNEAIGELSGISEDWQALSLPLSTLNAPAGFDWKQVKLCEFNESLNKDTVVHLDGIRFDNGKTAIGVTDKTIAQRMNEAEASLDLRIEAAMRASANNTKDGLYAPVSAFAKMLLNEDLETANELLVSELKLSGDGNVWSLLHSPLYCRFYYMFSNRHGKFPGRMTPETEALLLETLWNRTVEKNDIHWARQSTWYLDGSENHDLNAKACALVSSRIFMNEPDYKDRIYPDYGFGGGYHYGRAGYYGTGIDPETRHGGGRANLADGKEYTAADHYHAWLPYFKTYFRERAERSFFLEYGSAGYTKHVLNMVDLAYQYSGDDELKATIDDFLTLYWAEWAQVSISGVRGGPKSRHHHNVMEGTGTSDLVSFKLGGPGNAGVWWYWNLINDHKLPAVVWNMALDREGMGTYTYKARGIGEEENNLPRPLGTERSLVVDTDARFLKSTYVTPDYTLGTQMDHPSAVHSHLSIAGRWHGMTFAQSPDARIVPVSVPDQKNRKGKKNPYELEAMYQTLHHEQTLIVQQSRRWYAVHPEWFPVNADYDQPVGIWLGEDWDQLIEKDGWIFTQKGNAYAAIRPVLWDEAYEKARKRKTEGNQTYFNASDDPPTVKLRTDCYTWSEDKNILLYEDNHTATIIEAGRKADYPTLKVFMADVLDNPIALHKTVVPGEHILVYTGSGANAEEIIFNCSVPQIPIVDNQPIDHSHPMTFDSPYLKSVYKSGKIRIEYGDEHLDLDFSK